MVNIDNTPADEAQETEAARLNEQWDLITAGGTDFFLGIAPHAVPYPDTAEGVCSWCGYWAVTHVDRDGEPVSFADYHRGIRLPEQPGGWLRGFYLGEPRAERYAELIRRKRNATTYEYFAESSNWSGQLVWRVKPGEQAGEVTWLHYPNSSWVETRNAREDMDLVAGRARPIAHADLPAHVK